MTDKDSYVPYELSCTLLGHSKDVRCLDSADLGSTNEPGSSTGLSDGRPGHPILASGSRDFSARQWKSKSPRGFQEGSTLMGVLSNSNCSSFFRRHFYEPDQLF